MFHETVRSSGPLDELLARILTRMDKDALAQATALFDRDIAASLECMVAPQAEPEAARRLARLLAANDYVAAAAAALAQATAFSGTPSNPEIRAKFHDDAAALKGGLGLRFSANAHLRVARRLRGLGGGAINKTPCRNWTMAP